MSTEITPSHPPHDTQKSLLKPNVNKKYQIILMKCEVKPVVPSGMIQCSFQYAHAYHALVIGKKIAEENL